MNTLLQNTLLHLGKLRTSLVDMDGQVHVLCVSPRYILTKPSSLCAIGGKTSMTLPCYLLLTLSCVSKKAA